MKALITLALASVALTACNGQSSNMEDQKKIYKALDEMVARGMKPTTEGGYTMTATIDGKPWKAQAMYPIAMNSTIHACYAESTIDLPDPGNAKVGDKGDFSHGHGPIFVPPGPYDQYIVHTGQMEITKVSGDWLEGMFSFTAVSHDNPSKKIEVTNGFFRVAKKGR
jgi:hypothetical protein